MFLFGISAMALGLAASQGDDRTPDDAFIEKISSLRGVVLHREDDRPTSKADTEAAATPAPPQRAATPTSEGTPAVDRPTPRVGRSPSPEPTLPPAPAGGANPSGLVVLEVEMVSPLTGPESPSRTLERWNIKGTDLGITFRHDGKTYIVFGDTFGRAGIEKPDWRSNVMGVIQQDPRHAYLMTEAITDENGDAKELLASLKIPKNEYTVMPTSAISVGDRMYIHYMSIRDWDEQWWGYKFPIVNGSGFAYSDDGGKTWIKDGVAYWKGDTRFTQTSMVKSDGFVYVFGTPAGRFVPARVLRVPEDRLLEPGYYRYWDGQSWTSDESRAAIVVDWPVGELSVRWSEYHKRWLMMYKNEVDHTIVLRTAPRPEGPWDKERVVVTAKEFPSLYAPLMLPAVTGPDVYFTMSNFFPYYNVSLMRVRLAPV